MPFSHCYTVCCVCNVKSAPLIRTDSSDPDGVVSNNNKTEKHDSGPTGRI